MAGSDKTVQRDGAVIFLAGRNFILNSASPVLVIGQSARPFADYARVGTTQVADDEAILIITQPVDQNAAVGDTVTFSVAINGVTVTYRWEYSTDNGITWSQMTNGSVWHGMTTDTLSFDAQERFSTWLWRCRIAGSSDTVYTNWVKFNLTA